MNNRKKQVLVLAMHRLNRSPSQRFRYEQYIDYLETNGFEFTFSNLISEEDDKFFYKQGFILRKLFVLVKSVIIRLRDLYSAGNYDLIFIQREAFMLGTSFFERQISRRNGNLIFDFDDAIWKSNTEGGNAALSWLKRPSKLNEILPVCKSVIAGNSYLADYAKKYCSSVTVIPTTLDLEVFEPMKTERSTSYQREVVIGWTGTFSTLPYFEEVIPVLKQIKNKFPNVSFCVIADVVKYYPELDTDIILWDAKSEVDQLRKIDIGIMPLPNDEWTQGKCGFKGLQYMSLAKPAVLASVGVNIDIITDGVNGYLFSTVKELFNRLSVLVVDESLRQNIGNNGRITVEKRYSKQANREKYLAVFNSAIS